MADITLYNPNENKQQAIMTFSANTLEERKRLFNMTQSPDKQLGDCIGDVINIKDVYVEVVNVKNSRKVKDSDPDYIEAPRCILIDTDGVSYSCTSSGIYNALVRMFNILGMPTWEEGVPVKVKQINKGQMRILTLEMQ